MKKLLLIALLAVSFNGFAQADNKGKKDIYVGYGIVTAQDIIGATTSGLVGALVPGGYDKIKVSGMGAAFLGLDYYLSDKVAVGLQANYSSFTAEYVQSSGDNPTAKLNFFTPMARMKVNWKNERSLQVYSSVAAGASFSKGKSHANTTSRSNNFAFHISPIGVRLGNTVAVFGEAGFGYQGLLSAGLSVKL